MATEIGILAVRRSTFIAAQPDRVWEKFTTVERMKRWFGIGHELSRYEPSPDGYVETDSAFGGPIVNWEPPHELTFENRCYERDWEAPPLFTFRLTPALGGTVVELFSHSLERIGPSGPDALVAFEAGWETNHLVALREIVQGVR